MKVKLDKYAYKLSRGYPEDAGWDIKCPIDTCIEPRDSVVIRTGVHVQIPKGAAGLIISKSGLNTKHNIVSTGLIDEGYTGEIVIKLYNLGRDMYFVNKGDKISQIVFVDVRHDDLRYVPELDGGPRGANGFGSTGR